MDANQPAGEGSMKKPTRFERMVDELVQGDVPGWPVHMMPHHAVKLLAREHRAVVRHVNKVLRKMGKMDKKDGLTMAGHGHVAAYQAIREWLKARAA